MGALLLGRSDDGILGFDDGGETWGMRCTDLSAYSYSTSAGVEEGLG